MKDPETIAPTIETHGLCKSFGSLEVLKDISFTAREGNVVTILGASGSGKSTFLRCLNFLETPSSGEISFKGRRIAVSANGRTNPRDIETLRRRTGMVFQQFNLWSHWTVLENVMNVPLHIQGVDRKTAREKALALLERVGLAEKRSAYPASLSGGQQQRVAIARALAVDPDLLLFDEPTSALDPELVGEVLTAIRGLADEGRTMLIVTHEIGFARDVSDHVVFFRDGIIAEEGPQSILRHPQGQHLTSFLNSVRS